RLRLTLVFALGMAIVLAGFGAFVYYRLGRDILATVDLSLRARIQAIEGAIEQTTPAVVASGESLIDPDESFIQVLDANGRVAGASSELAVAPVLPIDALRSIREPAFFERTINHIDVDP